MNKTLTQLDVSDNEIGCWYDGPSYDRKAHPTPEGPAALAQAIGENTSVKWLGVSNNGLGPDGGKALAAALASNQCIMTVSGSCCSSLLHPQSKTDRFSVLFFSSRAIISTPSSQNMQLGVSGNGLGPEGGKALATALASNQFITTVCGSFCTLISHPHRKLTVFLCPCLLAHHRHSVITKSIARSFG